MDVRLSDEQQLLVDTAARLGAQHATPGIDHLPPTPDASLEVWNALAQAGLLELEGPGAAVAAALVAEQLAGVLSPAPYIGQGVLAPALLSAAGAEAELAALTAGTARYCLLLRPDLSGIGAPHDLTVAFDAADAQYGLTVDAEGALRRHSLAEHGAATGLDLTRAIVSVKAADGEVLGRGFLVRRQSTAWRRSP